MIDPKQVKSEETIKSSNSPVEESDLADIDLERVAGGHGSEYCVLPTLVVP